MKYLITQRVAQRWVQAAMFEPPPKVLKDATAWFSKQFASMVLHEVEYRLNSLQPEQLQEQLAYRKGRITYALRKAKIMSPENSPIYLRFQTYQVHYTLGVVGVTEEYWRISREDEGDVYKLEHSNDKRVWHVYEEDSPLEVVKEALEVSLMDLENDIKNDMRPLIVELNSIRKEALKHTSEKINSTLQIGSETTLDFRISDFKTWKYFDKFPRDRVTLAHTLKRHHWGNPIRVNLSSVFRSNPNMNGYWSEDEKKIQLYMEKPKELTLVEFKKKLRKTQDTVRHEVIHFGQSLLKDLMNLDDYAGLPSKKYRDPNYDSAGVDPETQEVTQEHAKRDVEFYTRLSDEVRFFLNVVKSVPKKYWSRAIPIWVDVKKDVDWWYTSPEKPGHDYRKLRASSFFTALKDQDIRKWKKAVKEFSKELYKKGFRP